MIVKVLFTICLFYSVLPSLSAQIVSKELKKQKASTYIPYFPPPEYLMKDKTYYFRGEKNGLKMDLQLDRKTTKEIRYKLSILFPNGQKLKEKGTVYMNFAYDMGTEELFQESTGEMESCTNFFPRVENGLIICIGDDYENGLPPKTDKLFVQVTLLRKKYPIIDIEEAPELFQLDLISLRK